jgi:hypothetical protein
MHIMLLVAFDPQVLLDEHASLAALMLFLGLLSLLAASFVAQHSIQILNNTTTNETAKSESFAAAYVQCSCDAAGTPPAATTAADGSPTLPRW